jgi:putative solute:sodium symporter small subunit
VDATVVGGRIGQRGPARRHANPRYAGRSVPPKDSGAMADTGNSRAYWKANLRLLLILLFVWFIVSYGCGILLVDVLNRVRIPGTGFPLGFWFAQQGSIYVFVILIFVYAWRMNRIDADHGVAEE